MNSRIIFSLIIVSFSALIGLSLAKVSASDPWDFTLGAAVISSVAVIVASIFRKPTASFEQATPPRKLLGLRIGVVGFVVALIGWLVAVFLSATAGYFITVLGVLAGFVGFPIHIYNMLRS